MSATKELAYPDYDDDVIASTFRLLGTGITLTKADKVVLMEPQHLSLAEKQAKARALRLTQERFVMIARLVCPNIAIEKVIVNTNRLREYFATAVMKAGTGAEETEQQDRDMTDV